LFHSSVHQIGLVPCNASAYLCYVQMVFVYKFLHAIGYFFILVYVVCASLFPLLNFYYLPLKRIVIYVLPSCPSAYLIVIQ
jgi:hypothetical protein